MTFVLVALLFGPLHLAAGNAMVPIAIAVATWSLFVEVGE